MAITVSYSQRWRLQTVQNRIFRSTVWNGWDCLINSLPWRWIYFVVYMNLKKFCIQNQPRSRPVQQKPSSLVSGETYVATHSRSGWNFVPFVAVYSNRGVYVEHFYSVWAFKSIINRIMRLHNLRSYCLSQNKKGILSQNMIFSSLKPNILCA